jgi:hypothetical protein
VTRGGSKKGKISVFPTAREAEGKIFRIEEIAVERSPDRGEIEDRNFEKIAGRPTEKPSGKDRKDRKIVAIAVSFVSLPQSLRSRFEWDSGAPVLMVLPRWISGAPVPAVLPHWMAGEVVGTVVPAGCFPVLQL